MPAPSRPSATLTGFLIWTPVALVVLCGMLAGVFIEIANADGWSGAGVPSEASMLGWVGIILLFGLAVGSPLLIGSFVWGLVRHSRTRRLAAHHG